MKLTWDEIRTGDFEAYYKEKNVRPNCPFCNSEEWTANGPEGTDKISVIVPELVDSNSHALNKIGLPMIALTCSNCGYVKLQALVPMLNWKKQKEQK